MSIGTQHTTHWNNHQTREMMTEDSTTKLWSWGWLMLCKRTNDKARVIWQSRGKTILMEQEDKVAVWNKIKWPWGCKWDFYSSRNEIFEATDMAFFKLWKWNHWDLEIGFLQLWKWDFWSSGDGILELWTWDSWSSRKRMLEELEMGLLKLRK